MDERDVLAALRAAREKDPMYGSGRILSAVYTRPLDVAVEAFRLYSDVNALDTHIFPSVRVLESEVLGWFSRLLSCLGLDGYVSTGATESNIAALWAARKEYPGRKEILAPESVHYSVHKAADLLGLSVKAIPLDDGFKADVSAAESMVSKKTLAVVATAGTSSLGVVDPIAELSELCGEVYFHVDAAFGGMVLPFVEKAPKFDFSLPNVDSIAVDPHKMGFAPIPAGLALFRDPSYLENLVFSPSYLPVRTPTLVGSRSGGSVAAVWAAIKHLGEGGYRKIIAECMDNTRLLCGELRRVGVPPLVEPELNFVAFRTDDTKAAFSALLSRGWNLVLDSGTGSIRVVVMPHVSGEVIKSFASDLASVI